MIHHPEDCPGALVQPDGSTRFRVWAPNAARAELVLKSSPRRLLMDACEEGLWELTLDDAPPGTRYAFSLDGGPERPDPASRSQPKGVHGPSEVIAADFRWTDAGFRAPALSDLVVYELHIGTFTPEGTFDSAVERLDELRSLGVNCVEIMPVAQFPGGRNWGYDGVGLYAAQNTYGGPEGLRRFVDAAHARGMSVCLDVVYNHLGPEGNYLGEFGPYFTDRYSTPWGEALNFDGPHSDHVRAFFIQNAMFWTGEMRIDALRLDALHAIADNSALPFIEELTASVHAMAERQGRRVLMIGESAANDTRLIRPRAQGGLGCDAQWNDDFHHALRTVLTGESQGYYASYGRIGHLAKAMRSGFVYTGEPSVFHQRRHGRPSEDRPPSAFVIFSQNHDQVGNRMEGDRLGAEAGFEALKLAAAATLLTPNVPMLFMGEEYAETAPFRYFVSHTDADLVEAVRKGRKAEFDAFAWKGEAPDPQSEETFRRSMLDWSLREREPHRTMLAWYRRLLRARTELGLADTGDDSARPRVRHDEDARWIEARWTARSGPVALLLNFAESQTERSFDTAGRSWRRVLCSADADWRGPDAALPERLEPDGGPALTLSLAPHSAALFAADDEL